MVVKPTVHQDSALSEYQKHYWENFKISDYKSQF